MRPDGTSGSGENLLPPFSRDTFNFEVAALPRFLIVCVQGAVSDRSAGLRRIVDKGAVLQQSGSRTTPAGTGRRTACAWCGPPATPSAATAGSPPGSGCWSACCRMVPARADIVNTQDHPPTGKLWDLRIRKIEETNDGAARASRPTPLTAGVAARSRPRCSLESRHDGDFRADPCHQRADQVRACRPPREPDAGGQGASHVGPRHQPLHEPAREAVGRAAAGAGGHGHTADGGPGCATTAGWRPRSVSSSPAPRRRRSPARSEVVIACSHDASHLLGHAALRRTGGDAGRGRADPSADVPAPCPRAAAVRDGRRGAELAGRRRLWGRRGRGDQGRGPADLLARLPGRARSGPAGSGRGLGRAGRCSTSRFRTWGGRPGTTGSPRPDARGGAPRLEDYDSYTQTLEGRGGWPGVGAGVEALR